MAWVVLIPPRRVSSFLSFLSPATCTNTPVEMFDGNTTPNIGNDRICNYSVHCLHGIIGATLPHSTEHGDDTPHVECVLKTIRRAVSTSSCDELQFLERHESHGVQHIEPALGYAFHLMSSYIIVMKSHRRLLFPVWQLSSVVTSK